MIKDIKRTKATIVQQLLDGSYILAYIISLSETIALNGCYKLTDTLTSNFNIEAKDIVAFGDTSKPPPSKVLKRILDTKPIILDDLEYKAYTCFIHIPRHMGYRENDSVHLSPYDSFNCLLESMYKAKYILILKINSTNIKDFNYDKNIANII